MITETEKEFVSENIINRVSSTSQMISYVVSDPSDSTGLELTTDSVKKLPVHPYSSYPIYSLTDAVSFPTGTSEIEIDLGDLDIICSHLMIAAFCPIHDKNGNLVRQPADDGERLYSAVTVVNGTTGASATGAIPSGILNKMIEADAGADTHRIHPADLFMYSGYTPADLSLRSSATAENVRGCVQNWLKSAELVIGNERTGIIPGSQLLNNRASHGLPGSYDYPVYIIPTADQAFSTAGVPLIKCSNKKLRLNVDNSILTHNGPFVKKQANTPFDNSTETGNAFSNTKPLYTKIVVVAAGNKVQTTVGGSISYAS